MLESGGPVIAPRGAEGMEIRVADIAPVLELDARLDGRVGSRHEFLLVDVDQPMEGEQGGNGGFADTDRADVVRFHQGDVDAFAKRARERCGCHPSRRTAAGNHHAADAVALHVGAWT
jgi:hypothetical protein